MTEATNYWNINRVLSYDVLINIILGQRGCGKTYGFKKYVLNRWEKHHEATVYLRNLKSDIEGITDWLDEFHEQYPNLEQRKNLIVDTEADEENNVVVFMYGLTQYTKAKSALTHNVTTIACDEFTDDCQWTRREKRPWCFLNIFDSAVRLRDNARGFLLGNTSVAQDNEYFHYFGIMPDLSKEFTVFRQKEKLVQFAKSAAFTKQRENTRFGRAIAGTPYAKMAIDNQFDDADEENIIKLPKHNWVICYIQDNQDSIGVYYNKIEHIYVAKITQPKSTYPVVTLDADMTAAANYYKYSKQIWQHQLRTAVSTGALYYNDVMSRTAAKRMLKNLGIL